jgi:predicted kinase
MDNASVAADLLASLNPPRERWQRPVLVGIFGLPGAGKTEAAGWLAGRLPLVLLTTDAVRLRYGLPSGPAAHAVMAAVAATLLPSGMGVIFDGIHLARRDRLAFRELARRHQADSALLHVTARPGVIAERLAARLSAPDRTAAEGKYVITADHFARIAAYF